ncbi:MAG: TolC family protein [Armatimonadetes bacterium]|nr:TolC family protein [Armatimonadota bacterium]
MNDSVCKFLSTLAVAFLLTVSVPALSAVNNTDLPQVPKPSAEPSSPPQTLETTEANPLTLNQAVNLALAHNPGLSIAKEAYRRAGGVLVQARGARLPNLSINASYQRFDKVETATFGTPPNTQKVELGQIDSKRATATLAQPVDVSGALGAGVSAAHYQQRAALYDFETNRQQLLLVVRQNYYALLQALEQERVAGESVALYKEQLRLANVRLEAGSAPKFDVLRAQTDLANAEQTLISAQNGVRIAEIALANTLGVRLVFPVRLQSPDIQPRTLPEVDQLIKEGESSRPEAEANEASIEAAKKGIHIARAGLSPSLQLAFHYNYNGNTTLFQPRQFTSDLLLSVSIPIFDGGVTRGRIEQAKANLETAKASYDQTDLNIRLDVEQAYVSIQNAEKRLATAQTTQAQAQEALRLAQVRYEAGVGTPVEITDAEVAYTQAQTNVVNARYDVLLAYARLARATGEPSYALD